MDGSEGTRAAVAEECHLHPVEYARHVDEVDGHLETNRRHGQPPVVGAGTGATAVLTEVGMSAAGQPGAGTTDVDWQGRS